MYKKIKMSYKIELKELIELQFDFLIEELFKIIDVDKNELIVLKNKILMDMSKNNDLKTMIKIPNFYDEIVENDYSEENIDYFLNN
jgi:hypothetical protein